MPPKQPHVLIRKPWIVICAAGLVAFVLWVMSTRSEPHHLRVAFPTAVSLVSGLDVQVDGLDAGKISKVQYRDGHAVVEIGVADDYWPLRQGTTATVRYGTTVGNGTRRVDLVPGPPANPALADGGIIDGKSAASPVELDQVFNTLNGETRTHMRGMLTGTAKGFGGHEAQLNAGLGASAKGMRGVQALLGDLAQDTYALRGLLVNAHRATRALAARRAELSSLVGVSAATFDEFAAHSAAIRGSLEQLPATLTATRGTLKRLDASVDGLEPLMADLAPGAASLKPLAPILRSAVARLRRDAPIGATTLTALRRAAPDLRHLLAEATPVTQNLAPVLSQLSPMLACIRPYAPEAAGALSNWASYNKNYDGISHYARVKVTASPYALNSFPDLTTKQFIDTFAGTINYAMPRPPGLNAGQPWFLPECGAGPDALDPAKDPEETSPLAPRPGVSSASSAKAAPSATAPAPASDAELLGGLVKRLQKGLGR